MRTAATESAAPAPRSPGSAPFPTAPSSGIDAVLGWRVAAFLGDARSAVRAVPKLVPDPRQDGEGFEAYGERATKAAVDAAAPIRTLVARERAWLATVDRTHCALAAGYQAVLNVYSMLADAIWAAFYAPDPALLRQALADLEAVHRSVAATVAVVANAPDACAVGLEAGVGELATRVIGTQSTDILRDPARLHESAMGNLVADALRSGYVDVDGALVNSGGLRIDLVVEPPTVAERPGEITWGELLSVLPFGNRTAIVAVRGDRLASALRNGFAPSCDPAFTGGTGRFPQISGLRVAFHCEGTTPVIDGLWRVGDGDARSEARVRARDTVRLVTLDYLVGGGDGYRMLPDGTKVEEPGKTLLDVVEAYLAKHSPVSPSVEGRIVGP